MKCKYIFMIFFIVILFVGIVVIVIKTSFDQHSNIDKAIQIAAIFTAIIASIIALAISDPKLKQIKSEFIVKKIEEEKIYKKNEMSEKLKKYFMNYSDKISSYQVHFKIKNTSGFDLKKPTITIRVPSERKCPNKNNRSPKYTERILTSNLYNSPQDLKKLECGDNTILSNNILPFLNDGDPLTFYVRMLINNESSEKFSVEVSLNSENAEGFNKEVQIDPKELISTFKQKVPSAIKSISV